MFQRILTLSFVVLASFQSIGQNLELMTGHEELFVDVQWLKFLGNEKQFSVFNRTRATVTYENQTDVFTGAYFNYSLKSGLGLSAVGKIGSNGAGVDAGVHMFKLKPNYQLFALVSVGVKNQLEYSWFSILRVTPPIRENWRLYTSIELYTLFGQTTHLVSVQRLRLGLDYRRFQFGFAANFGEFGSDWTSQSNIGGFIRKSF